eukprot:1161743-Pelagomonas_calceolata.AAC.1
MSQTLCHFHSTEHCHRPSATFTGTEQHHRRSTLSQALSNVRGTKQCHRPSATSQALCVTPQALSATFTGTQRLHRHSVHFTRTSTYSLAVPLAEHPC